ETVAASQTDRQLGRQDPRRQPHPGPPVALLHRGQGQGRTRPGPRQAGPRQAAGHGPPGRTARGDPRTGPARQGHGLIGVALALASALGYGVSDFVGGLASRRVAALRVVLVSYPIAMVLLTILATIVGGHITGA